MKEINNTARIETFNKCGLSNETLGIIWETLESLEKQGNIEIYTEHLTIFTKSSRCWTNKLVKKNLWEYSNHDCYNITLWWDNPPL